MAVRDEVEAETPPVADPHGHRLAVPAGGRRRRLEGGRRRIVKIRLSDPEFEALAVRAKGAGVSVQRLVVDAALADGAPTPAERRALWSTLLAARRQVAGLATNVNQLAKVANSTGRVPAGTAAALARIAAIDDRLTEAAAGLAE